MCLIALVGALKQCSSKLMNTKREPLLPGDTNWHTFGGAKAPTRCLAFDSTRVASFDN